jgi:DNA-binding CsgD family transcriptional regulator
MDLVEREKEVAYLGALLKDLERGRGSTVVISGAVAAGKSQLVHSFCENASESGAIVLTATGSEIDRGLPLEVLKQILHDVSVAPEDCDEVNRLLNKGAMAAIWTDLESEAVQQVWAQVMQRVWATVLKLANQIPVIIAVDDAHYADGPSMQVLLYFARRLRLTRVLLLLTAPESPEPVHLFQEFMRLPYCHQLRLAPLTEAGVARALTEALGATAPGQLALTLHQVTGGNPLLVNAIVADQGPPDRAGQHQHAPDRAGQPALESDDLLIGEVFSNAVLSCLHRAGAQMTRVARGVAILGEVGCATMLAELLKTDHATVLRAIRTLTGAGLLDCSRFRHAHARAVVLSQMDPYEHELMRLRAARLLYKAGADATTLAEHLVAANQAPDSWMPHTLEEAARLLLAEDRVEHAGACLELARGTYADDAKKARITALLASVEWRINPAKAKRHIPELISFAQSGLLHRRDMVMVVKFLLWHGHLDSAVEVVRQMGSAEEPTAIGVGNATDQAELLRLRSWLACTYPTLTQLAGKDATNGSHIVLSQTAAQCDMEAALVLAEVFAHGGTTDDVSRAERLLAGYSLSEATFEPITSALLALIYAERLDKAAHWCGSLLRQAEARQTTAWHAVLLAIQAQIALRKGALPMAEKSAQSALAEMSASGWGLGIGAPLSVLLLATGAMGKFEEGAAALNQPVPEAMFQSRFGLQYLYARGQYHLAADVFHTALSDFMACGKLMAGWGLDLPAFIPWRTAAAAAYLATGRRDQARKLVDEQLRRPGAAHPRTRGISLRLLAATSDLRQRPSLLRQAIDVLQSCGDRLELARALADLSGAQRALGEPNRARLTGRFASRVAEECHAQPLLRVIQIADHGAKALKAQNGKDNGKDKGTHVLSDAERRVATLAARGDTNGEIARSLFITVSTVEQHLTRVYRKLNVPGRAGLPAGL